MQYGSLPPGRFAWSMLILALAAGYPIALGRGYYFPVSSLWSGVLDCSSVLVCWLVLRFVLKFEILALVFACALYAKIFDLFVAPLQWVAAGFEPPLIDPILVQLDRALGFNLPALQIAANVWDAFAFVIVAAYRATIVYLKFAVLVLAAFAQYRRLQDFFGAVALAGLICIVSSALWTAEGAHSYFGFSPDQLGNFRTYCPSIMEYVGPFRAARAHEVYALDAYLPGIVQFPSFHAVMAFAGAWALWPVPVLRYVGLMISGVVLLGTVFVGGHYVMDILAGAMITVASIAIAQRFSGGRDPSIQMTLPNIRSWTPSGARAHADVATAGSAAN